MTLLHDYINEEQLIIPSMEEGMLSTLTDGIKENIKVTSDKVSRSYGVFKDFIYSTGKLDTPKKIRKLRRNIDNITRDVKFIDVHEYRVLTIPGLSVNLVKLTTSLKEYFERTKDIHKELDLLDTHLSNMLARKDARKSFIKSSKELETYRAELVDKPKEDFKGYFDPDDYRETTILDKLINSNSEIPVVLDNLIAIDDYMDDKYILKLNNLINNIYKKTLMITEGLDKGEEYSNVSLESLLELLDIYSKSMTTLSTYFYIYSKTMDLALKFENIYKR
jgi:hypothetical protein